MSFYLLILCALLSHLLVSCGFHSGSNRDTTHSADSESDEPSSDDGFHLASFQNFLPGTEYSDPDARRHRPQKLACDFATKYMPGQFAHCDGGFRLAMFDETYLGGSGPFQARFDLVYNSHLFHEYEDDDGNIWAKLARYNDDELELGEGDYYGAGVRGGLPRLVKDARGKKALLHGGDKLIFVPVGSNLHVSEPVTEHSEIQTIDGGYLWKTRGVYGYIRLNDRGLPVYEKRQDAKRKFYYDPTLFITASPKKANAPF